MIHHFILTRFNLHLWNKDKCGKTFDRQNWLEERFALFEKYTLPSVMAQSCQEFEWIILADGDTPQEYRMRFTDYKYPNINVLYVKSEAGFRFAEAFHLAVKKRLEDHGAKTDDVCLTTYFDNDDMIDASYISKVQSMAKELATRTFITYDYGYQFFTELNVKTRVKYPNNHFMTLVEDVDDVRTCYGYGSHFLLDKNKNVRLHHIVDKSNPMWTEVIHTDNVDNDVKMTFDTKIVSGNCSARLRFYMRAMGQICRRTRDKFIPRKW